MTVNIIIVFQLQRTTHTCMHTDDKQDKTIVDFLHRCTTLVQIHKHADGLLHNQVIHCVTGQL